MNDVDDPAWDPTVDELTDDRVGDEGGLLCGFDHDGRACSKRRGEGAHEKDRGRVPRA